MVGGEHAEHQGRVEVLYNGAWGRICHNYLWDFKEANVVCRQLGYDGAVQTAFNGNFEIRTGVIGVTGVQCVANETSISECKHRGQQWGVVRHCSQGNDVGVMCTPSGETMKGARIGSVSALLMGTSWKESVH